MRLTRIGLLSVAVVAVVLANGGAAEACSAMLRPAAEVVRASEVILRARAVRPKPWWRVGPGQVALKVLEVLKGAYHAPFLTVDGRLQDYRSDPSRRPPYEQIDCVGRNPGCGGCFAKRYKDGAQYLLLLRGGTPYWAPLSPTNEEISGPADPWVQWVTRHAGA